MLAKEELGKPLKTWSHLVKNKRRPTEYEIVSTNTLWNTPNHGLNWKQAGATPVMQWRDKYRDGSPLRHRDWDAFRDPDQLVYRTYNLMQDGQETYVDGLLNEYSNNEHDLSLSPAWIAMLQRAYTPGRYLLHTAQMSLGYLVALAPSSTVANPLMFQCADQLRWLSRIAYRTAELAAAHPTLGFGKVERREWEDGAGWQGFLELAERTLVTWDWGEQMTALGLVFKPAIDEAFARQLGKTSRNGGDTLTGMLLDAQLTDSERSRRFMGALVRFLCEDSGFDNRRTMQAWIDKWAPLGDRAIEGFCGMLGAGESAAKEAKQEAAAFRAQCGFK